MVLGPHLVHEAWLRLTEVNDRCWNNKAQFFRTAAKAMRGILVDRVRRKAALKQATGNLFAPRCGRGL
jgi:hypothetical protein